MAICKIDAEGLTSINFRIDYARGVVGKEGISFTSCKNPWIKYYILSGFDWILRIEIIVLYSMGANGFFARPVLVYNYQTLLLDWIKFLRFKWKWSLEQMRHNFSKTEWMQLAARVGSFKKLQFYQSTVTHKS